MKRTCECMQDTKAKKQEFICGEEWCIIDGSTENFNPMQYDYDPQWSLRGEGI